MQFIGIPTEQTTAITDLMMAILAVGCVVYVRNVGLTADRRKTTIWSIALALLAIAGFLGFIAHGFQMSEQTNRIIWMPLNLMLGLAIAFFVVGAIYDLWGDGPARRAQWIMLVVGVAFFLVTILIPGSFLIFIIYEAIAMLFALVGYIILALRKRLEGAWLVVAGIFVTIIAAGVQASGAVNFTLIWEFDYNGAFHLIQMVGVVLLVAGLAAALRCDTKIA